MIIVNHLKGYCQDHKDQQHSIKYFSKFCFIIKIFQFVSDVNGFYFIFELNSSNIMIIINYLKRDCQDYKYQQLSTKYFDQIYRFVIKIYPFVSEFVNGLYFIIVNCCFIRFFTVESAAHSPDLAQMQLFGK